MKNMKLQEYITLSEINDPIIAELEPILEKIKFSASPNCKLKEKYYNVFDKFVENKKLDVKGNLGVYAGIKIIEIMVQGRRLKYRFVKLSLVNKKYKAYVANLQSC